jgi:hypothetical protein
MNANLFNNPAELYDKLLAHSTKELRGRVPQALLDCPFCGADNQKHLRASFGQVFENMGWGFHCFACGKSCSLYHLATILNIKDAPIKTVERVVHDPELPSWYKGREYLDKAYTKTEGRYEAWSTYKGVTQAMVDKYALGYGVLPGDKGYTHSCPHYRLITPILDETGYVAWFRGRTIDCGCNSWHSASLRDYSMAQLNIALPMSHYAQTGGEVFICENYVDAGLINMSSRYSAVATLSVSYWLPKWTQQLRALNPTRVFMAYDNDLSGNYGTRQQVIDRAVKFISKRESIDTTAITVLSVNIEHDKYTVDWQAGHRQGVQNIASPRGVILANHLLQSGFNVRLLKWPKGAKDIGQWLTN